MTRYAAQLNPGSPGDVLNFVDEGADVIVPVALGEPHTVIDALEAGADRLRNVHIHQMDPGRERPYIQGRFPGRLEHVDYFLGPGSPVKRMRTAPANWCPPTSANCRGSYAR
jgi:hypothetical protein